MANILYNNSFRLIIVTTRDPLDCFMVKLLEMSVTPLKVLSVVRNHQSRPGQCLHILKRNVSNNSKPSDTGLKVPESERYVNPLSNLGKFRYYFLFNIFSMSIFR